MYTLPWVPMLNASSELTNSSQNTKKHITNSSSAEEYMSNHRSVHLNSGLLPLPLPLPLPFPFFLLLCFHQACLVLLGSVLVRTNGGKRSLHRHGSSCCVGNTKKTSFYIHVPCLILHRPSIRILKHTSERGMNDGVEEGQHIVIDAGTVRRW